MHTNSTSGLSAIVELQTQRGVENRQQRFHTAKLSDSSRASVTGPTTTRYIEEDSMSIEAEALREEIRRRYADAAKTAAGGQQATDGPDDACLGTSLYDDLEGIPEGAGLASLGCGNPIAVADLAPGETVLDLGSGGGIDVLLSAKRVGPTGHAYGLDMTDEMLDLARRNAAEAGATNVTFLKGQIEQIPLPDAIVDVIISNCVINLSTDKPAVFAEMQRVLRNGGRVGIRDVVVDNDVDPAVIVEQAARI